MSTATAYELTLPEVPPLENGDRLSRAEFERRYESMPRRIKAELLDGVVFMSSPIRADFHGDQQGSLICWTNTYKAATPGVRAPDNATVRLDDANEPQPDASLFLEAHRGGQSIIDEDGYIFGAPEWAGEVSASSVSYDLHVKKEVYRRFGVREYLVWRVLDQAIDWFVLRHSRYQRLKPVRGVLQSTLFPGLWLHVKAMIKGDMAKVLAVLNQGLATPEHAAFVKQLRQRRS